MVVAGGVEERAGSNVRIRVVTVADVAVQHRITADLVVCDGLIRDVT
jgi:hypothetical protein